MRQIKAVLAGATVAAVAVALSACGSKDAGTGGGGGGAPSSVKIGFMGDLTGESAGIVVPPANGAQLAIEEYNATNPRTKIDLVKYDSQGNPTQAVPLAQKAVQTDKIVGLIGPAFSGESKNVGPILEEAKIPSISPSATNVDLAKNGWKYWHRVVANDGVQGPGLADFVARALKPKAAFVIDDKSTYGKGLADAVTATLKAGGVTPSTDSIDPAGSDFATTVNKVKAANPDVVFFGGYYSAAGKLLKQLRDGGVKTAKFVTGDGSLDKGLIDGAGAANAEGALIGCPCLIASTSTDPAAQKFSTDYKAKFNAEPAVYATEGFDAASVFIEAVKAGNTTPETINSYLKTVDYKGVSKEIKFQDNGEPTVNDVLVYQVKNGKITLVGNSKEATVG
ncbi:MAG TPA: branched-chain amino acid ABC transporter substrate-binding protein [Mycobacteriales bacterium]|nr:branched-chain amino acid ABC transporter substrate-binding protein [Mycobacteriales bacterium]